MENQRIRLTKSMLKGALIELLKVKNIEKITVYELCEKAQINRTTFYKYYGSQFDLLSDIVDELFVEIEEYLQNLDPEGFDSFVEMMLFIDRNSEKWKVLINSVSDKVFTDRLFSLPSIAKLVRENIKILDGGRQQEYLMLFYCQGGYAIIRKWLNEEERDSPEEIARIITFLGASLHK